MSPSEALAVEFQGHRDHMRAVAHRMLGSAYEAEDAVQEAWLRLERTEAEQPDDLGAWLRTVVSRICLDMLRARSARPEDLVERMPEAGRGTAAPPGPEEEAVMADSVGRALLVVLNALGPDERIAFVLHDLFMVPFTEIAGVVERSPDTAKKLASRARGRVRGVHIVRDPVHERQRQVVEAFLAAARAGDIGAIRAVLDDDVVRRADRTAIPGDRALEAHGASVVAQEIAVFGRNAAVADVALVDGAVGIVVAPLGRLTVALRFSVVGDVITGYELVADPARLEDLHLAVLDDPAVAT